MDPELIKIIEAWLPIIAGGGGITIVGTVVRTGLFLQRRATEMATDVAEIRKDAHRLTEIVLGHTHDDQGRVVIPPEAMRP